MTPDLPKGTHAMLDAVFCPLLAPSRGRGGELLRDMIDAYRRMLIAACGLPA